ncbi:MAG: glycosyltransferase family 2 protein [Opitutales bacterium]
MNISTAPRVLAGITTRNRAAILPKALASLRAQSYPKLSIAVLDDGSEDATPSLAGQYPGVHWQRHATPLGIIESRNELMRGTEAEYYLSLDDDAWFLHGDEIAIAVNHLQTHPTQAAVAFDILSPDRPEPVPRTAPVPVAMFIGCGHLLRLSSVREAGYYAPSPGAYGSEEKDLSLRLGDLDRGIALLPGVHIWHDKAWTGRDWYPLHRSGVCNELVMTLRRCPLPDLILVLPLKIASFAWYWIRAPRFLCAGLAGLTQFLRLCPAACRTRVPVRRDTFWRLSRHHQPRSPS